MRRQLIKSHSVEFDGALGHLPSLWSEHSRDRLQCRCFAGAVPAEQRRNRPLPGDKRDAFEHQDDAIVDHFYIIERQQVSLRRPDSSRITGPPRYSVPSSFARTSR